MLDAALSQYASGTRKWGSVVARLDALARASTGPRPLPHAPGFDRERLGAIGGVMFSTAVGVLQCACGDGAAAHPDAATMRKCSWCGTPSALLRKCARCHAAWWVSF